MLAVADLLLSTTTVPKTLAIFWFRAGVISLEACITQVVFIHAVSCAESAILLAMEFGQYVAVSKPLKYVTLLTKRVTGTIGLAALARSLSIVFPIVLSVKCLTFCRNKLLPHTYCKCTGTARLAWVDITTNAWCGVTIAVFVIGVDATLIAASYPLILQTVFHLPSKDAWLEALSTCSSHLLVILLCYTLAFSSFFAHHFGHRMPRSALIVMANLCVLSPPGMLNPIIYRVTNKQIQKSAVQVLYQCRSRG